MKYKVYVTMRFCTEVEADSVEDVYDMAGDIDFSWDDWCGEEITDVEEVREQ